ncbi:MAG: GNAT family N-acetyltransferase [Streptosporangiaceae bacterium]
MSLLRPRRRDDSVQVRLARPGDQAALVALERAAWTAQSGFPSVIQASSLPGAGFFSENNPPQIHLVAELDTAVVGYIRLKPPTTLPENGHVLHVSGIAVQPGARRRGVATTLLSAAEPFARNCGAVKISLRVLGTNDAAIALYERLGYVREGVLHDEFIINGQYVDDVMMAKPVP